MGAIAPSPYILGLKDSHILYNCIFMYFTMGVRKKKSFCGPATKAPTPLEPGH